MGIINGTDITKDYGSLATSYNNSSLHSSLQILVIILILRHECLHHCHLIFYTTMEDVMT